jgi:hypothetical protein
VNVLPRPTLSEAEFQQAVMDLARIFHWDVLHVRKSIGRRNGKAGWQTTTNIRGWPDLFMFKAGCGCIAAELKSATGKVTDEQRTVLASLAAAGVDAYVWRPADLDAIAARLKRRPCPMEGTP